MFDTLLKQNMYHIYLKKSENICGQICSIHEMSFKYLISLILLFESF